MYREVDANTIRKILNVEDDYSVDTLITYGTHPKQATEKLFQEQIQKLFPHAETETPFTGFFQDIKSYKIGNTRLWFCVTYGGAMTSEVVHIAALLGAQKMLHGGSCGALDETLTIGDLLVPQSSTADESCTRMYRRDTQTIHPANTQLQSKILSQLDTPANDGPILSIQAMLAETREDIKDWSEAGLKAVDLETATVFAVANHFQVPAAALLYISDNLVTEELVHKSTEEQKIAKTQAKQTAVSALIQAACT